MSSPERLPIRPQSYLFAFGLIAVFLLLAHGPILSLPFFWDESGQFIPAALDLFRSGSWVPVSTVPNIHPPGLMALLAAIWKLFGFSITTTRVTMLLVAAAGGLASFLLAIELSRRTPGTPAFTALALLCLSPLFFAQSMLAQLDMPAMGLTALALLLFLQNHHRASALACLALVLVKETGVVAPIVFIGWLLWERKFRDAVWYLAPFAALAAWLTVLHHVTGSWFGNRAFESYNLWYPLRPDRLLFALLRRFYYLFIGSGHFIGTAALIYAWKRMSAFRDRSWQVAAVFAGAHVLTVSALGGAVLERYLLPVLPIVYIAFAIAVRSLLPRQRTLALTGLVVCLILANTVNPIYPFPFENNLAFVSFVQLEQSAVAQAEFSGGAVASAFPVADGLRNPDLGFVENPPKVVEIADFSGPEIEKLKRIDPYAVVVYSRTWDPLGLLNHPAVSRFLADHYGYQPQLSAHEIAKVLHMHIAWHWNRRGLTMDVLHRGEEIQRLRL
jgi:4-amino-4-deoxy-L-arabinose transferase-like glycosyltransferase